MLGDAKALVDDQDQTGLELDIRPVQSGAGFEEAAVLNNVRPQRAAAVPKVAAFVGLIAVMSDSWSLR